MHAIIDAMDDASALGVLSLVTRYELDPADPQDQLTRPLAEALALHFGATAGAGQRVSDGDLARHAILLLAEDRTIAERIAALAEAPPTRQFGIEPLTAIALGTAVLMVLKTKIEIRRDKDGRWSFHLKSDALCTPLLKILLEKLLSWLPGGPGG